MTSLLIVGASVRAAWQSAKRAGLSSVQAADLFGDVEVRDAERFWPMSFGYPELSEVLRACGADAWMYTGAVENYPDRVAEAASLVPLWGNAGECLRRVRDPWTLAAVLEGAGIRTPELAREPIDLPLDESWLCKPIASAAGLGIHALKPNVKGDQNRRRSRHYYQRRVPGRACGGVFVGSARHAWLWGVTEQWNGVSHGAPSEFQYVGSIGPQDLSGKERMHWQTIGNCLANAFDLRGLFGVDAMVFEDVVVPVEVNPRFTASVELLERTTGRNGLLLHWQACRQQALPAESESCLAQKDETGGFISGKKIVYVPRPTVVTPELHAWIRQLNDRSPAFPQVADIPAEGTVIEVGAPLLTVLDDEKLLDDRTITHSAGSTQQELFAEAQSRLEGRLKNLAIEALRSTRSLT